MNLGFARTEIVQMSFVRALRFTITKFGVTHIKYNGLALFVQGYFLMKRPIHALIIAVVGQFYATEIISEYVIRGNNAVLKCSIPAFVADYVSVISWIDSQDQVYEIGARGIVQLKYVITVEKNGQIWRMVTFWAQSELLQPSNEFLSCNS